MALPRPHLLCAPLLAVALLLAVVGCGSDAPEPDAIERARFVDVMVELRMAALDQEDASLPPDERARILSEHGVTEEDLLAFARVHGDDPAFMVEVWREIEERLNVPVDSAAAGEPS